MSETVFFIRSLSEEMAKPFRSALCFIWNKAEVIERNGSRVAERFENVEITPLTQEESKTASERLAESEE